jgi:hypothetical protein
LFTTFWRWQASGLTIARNETEPFDPGDNAPRRQVSTPAEYAPAGLALPGR